MDFDEISSLRDRHPAWRLLRRDHAPLVLGFLGHYFVIDNKGATSASVLAAALEDEVFTLNAANPEEPLFPRPAEDYLEDWAGAETGWLRRFYPIGSDEVHYDATPAFEKAYAWVESLKVRPFVGTESRLATIIELLRQMVFGIETDPQVRLAELRRRREEIDLEIAQVEADQFEVIDATALRDRYQQFASTARELLSDFREVEENFRTLDRAARERIAAWDDSKGNLLADLVGSRSDIDGSDQGRSFQAFYDLLLSEARQEELSDLLRRIGSLDQLEADRRLGTIHHDWAEAAERTQQTIRQISEQLRRFLDDQIWLENRRVLDLLRSIEASALTLRNSAPELGLEVDQPGVAIALPLERPLHDARPDSRVESLLDPDTTEDLDTTALLSQSFIDMTRLADHIRTVVPRRGSALLEDIIGMYPLEQGAAELVGYLSLADEDLHISVDEEQETTISFDEEGQPRRVRLPQVTVSRT